MALTDIDYGYTPTLPEEREPREFHVLVEQTIVGWVTVHATSRKAAEKEILKLSVKVPNQRESRYARQTRPVRPVMRHGRVRVLQASRTCGPEPKMLLRLDCGHTSYIGCDLWFPDNPWIECSACQKGCE